MTGTVLDNVINEINFNWGKSQTIRIIVDMSDNCLIKNKEITPYAEEHLRECFKYLNRDNDLKVLISSVFSVSKDKELEPISFVSLAAERFINFYPTIKRIIKEKSQDGKVSYYGSFIALGVYAMNIAKSSEVNLLGQKDGKLVANL